MPILELCIRGAALISSLLPSTSHCNLRKSYPSRMSSAATIAPPTFASLPFDEKLDRFARVAVHVGLNLRPGQELVISATTEMMPLVRRITEHAYKAGALLVSTLYVDDETALARYKYAPDASFDFAPVWLADGIAAAFRSGAARLALTGANPALLAGQDPGKVSRANIAASKANKPARHQLVDSGCGDPSMGKAGISERARGNRRSEALGCHLHRVARHLRRSGRNLEAA